MKNILKISICVCLCLILMGCGCSKKEDNQKKNNETKIEKISDKLYTDDTKLVFNNNNMYKLVFYYNDLNQITGYEHYYEYATEKDAENNYKTALEELSGNILISKIERKNNYVIYTMANSEYEGKSVDDIKESYSFLIPVYKNN